MTPETGTCTEVHEDWRRFQAVPSMVDHWDRPGWSPGREAYYWYLTFNSPELTQLAATCQQQLELAYLDPVPLDRLHLTLPRIGWTDQVTDRELDQVFAEAEERCRGLEAFPLAVGPLAGSPGAIRLSVSPWEPVVELRDRLHQAVESSLGVNLVESSFRPHIGVAYCNSPVQPALLITQVAKLRSLPPVEVVVKQIELVRLRRENNSYLWSTVGALTLR